MLTDWIVILTAIKTDMEVGERVHVECLLEGRQFLVCHRFIDIQTVYIVRLVMLPWYEVVTAATLQLEIVFNLEYTPSHGLFLLLTSCKG
jgi:hypothetical protein